MTPLPAVRPARPLFSSGPCAKRPGWSPDELRTESLGRSHRSKLGKSRLKHAIDLTREVLQVPTTHRIGIVPASDTGAVEMAMWTMLGARPTCVLAWESFGEGWVTDAVKQLRLDPKVLSAEYGHLPDLSAVPWDRDVVFTWNGTTSGVRVPDGAWIADDREGLSINDATSAAFAMEMPWDKLDVTTFSFQKVMGGEGGHGVIVLGPRAVERLHSYKPAWPLPKIFRLSKGGELIEGIFEGETINTPSMLVIEDWIDALEWARGLGGLPALIARTEANARALFDWVERTPWIEPLAVDPATRSTTSVCLRLPHAAPDIPKRLAALLERERVAFDIGAYRDAPPGLRIWCGATVDTADVIALTHWLDWACAEATAAAAA
jgi:phosphoserine aminotransferase